MIKKCLYIFGFLCIAFQARAAGDSCSVFALKQETYKDSLERFREIYRNKVIGIPDSFELALYTALRFYPDLKFDRIEIRYQQMTTSMEARPLIKSLFNKKRSRSFIIAINNRKGPHKGVDWSKANFGILVGWFAHELGHCEQYQDRGFFGIAAMGIKYITVKSYHRQIENNADVRAIMHDLGYCLYVAKVFLHENSGADAHYLALADKYYMSPEGILKKIDELKLIAKQ